ncbi:hypothetical protein HZF24_05525 [Sedimentibacter hydroxybenzoicus DSM 7310]|uniref:VCBS repeat-containing protein n=1 Tax=Sedimentibacter hydroxybenzoicus DSM 7310 TaxID=1123245 RepID=A0A974GVN9_SEDHY|nr:hypothetical protein [Sedimentibacter hydroxybenzoicus]NYB73597.1 hypothetical protein [Sedimentibacter hydroxybenzoicus DSM 7310]
MKAKLIFLITIIMMLAACANNNEELIENGNDIIENNDNTYKNVIDLSFTSVPKTALIEGLPEEGWIRGKSIYFGDLPNQIESTVHLYVDSNENPELRPGEGTIYGFLEHDNKLYELGEISSYGFNGIDVNLSDRTYDGIKEINITGGMGATYIELKVIAYNKDSNEWENLLTMGSPAIADLDRDGQDELIAGSTGSLPPFVDIYRWNNDCFERAEITEATGNLYAYLDTINDEWIIKSGLQNVEPKLYKYEAGKLIEYK